MEIILTNQIFMIMTALGIFAATAYFILPSGGYSKKAHLRALKILGQYSKQPSLKGLSAAESAQAISLKKLDKDSRLHGSIRGLPSISRLRERLDRTGKDISVGQYFKWNLFTAIISFVVIHFVFGSGPVLSALLGIFFGLMIPHKMVGRWESKRLKKFLLLLPDGLDLMVRGLRSGLPVTESVNAIKDEITEPLKSIFGEVSQKVRIGVPFEEALMNTAKRLKINEFNFLVISITLQRETGGNLAEILENLSSTIRARTNMKLKILAITSEARMSAYIVGALPFLVTIALAFIQPDYLDPLFNDIRGNIALACAILSFSFGMFIMLRMAKFEI